MLMAAPRAGAGARMAIVQLSAIGASLVLLLMQGTVRGPGSVGFSVVIVCGLGLLRVLTIRASLAMSTFVVEPIGSMLLMAGTGGPASPFLPMAMAGIWWAAWSLRGTQVRPFRIVRNSGTWRVEPGHLVEMGPKRPTALVYGISMSASYALLVVLPALRDGMGTEALEDAIMLATTWVLAEMLVPARTPARIGAAEPAITLRASELTPAEQHMLACLARGLSNREIAEQIGVGQGAVRYRLTRLYRDLDVSGREGAIGKARQYGLAVPVDSRLPGS